MRPFLGVRIAARVWFTIPPLIPREFDVPSLHLSAPVPPTLVVHDAADSEVGPEHARAIADAWPGARLVLTEGLGHHRLLRDPAVIDRAVRFVTRAQADRRPA